MSDDKVEQELKLEIEKLDKKISGLGSYLTDMGFPKMDEELFSDITVSTIVSRQQIGLEETKRKLSDIFEKVKKEALNVGISEDDITDEKLIGYNVMQAAEFEQGRINSIKERKEGKSPEEILLNRIFGDPKKH